MGGNDTKISPAVAHRPVASSLPFHCFDERVLSASLVECTCGHTYTRLYCAGLSKTVCFNIVLSRFVCLCDLLKNKFGTTHS